MGTRADFYIKTGSKLQWLGSIAWDGSPDSIDFGIIHADGKRDFRKRVKEFLASREDATLPKMGWPWPWETSSTTDYAYIFDGETKVSYFGSKLQSAKDFRKLQNELHSLEVAQRCLGEKSPSEIAHAIIDRERTLERFRSGKTAFPDMSAVQKVNFGSRSGLIIIGGSK